MEDNEKFKAVMSSQDKLHPSSMRVESLLIKGCDNRIRASFGFKLFFVKLNTFKDDKLS